MLGVWSNPAGIDTSHLTEHVTKKYIQWIDRSTNGHLPCRLNWTSYKFKLYPGIRYGLATLATLTSQVDTLFQKLDYRALPLLGVNWSIKREWRNIPRAFGGIGLFNLAAKQMIGWTNLVLQHYGTPTTLGDKLKALLEALQLEIGCTENPLSECYKTRGVLATPTWVTVVWERCQRYDLRFHLAYTTVLEPSREHDITIVQLLLDNGISGMELRRLNRCRLSLQAIFLYDLATAGGKYLETWVTNDRNGRLSSYHFPREQPSTLDWDLWDEFWTGWLNRNNTMPLSLGKWLRESHHLWRRYFDSASSTLWEQVDKGWSSARTGPWFLATRARIHV